MPNSSPKPSIGETIVPLLTLLIKRGSPKQYAIFFQRYHEADIAEALEELSLEEQYKFFVNVKPEIAVEILEEMGMGKQIQLISDFKTDLAAQFIQEMDPDDAADLLEELFEEDQEKAETIFKALPKEDAEDIKELLSYPEDSAGSIMTSEFIAISENLSIKEAIEHIRQMDPPNSEISFFIFVVDEQSRLQGYITLRNLVFSSDKARVKEIRKENPITVDTHMDQEEVAKLFQKYNYTVVPVVNNQQEMVGLITVDDIVDVVVEEATEDLYKLSGTSDIDEEKLISGKIVFALQSRLPWLILTIFGGFIASYLITIYSDLFKPTLFPLALSLSFVPLLMGLGGNVGNQSATIFVRGLSTGFIKDKNATAVILRELGIGGIIGLIIGACVFLFMLITQHSLIFSLIVSVAMFLNISVATSLGALLPILLKKINIDPAVASAPFISTSLDIIGQIIYFLLTIGTLYLISAS